MFGFVFVEKIFTLAARRLPLNERIRFRELMAISLGRGKQVDAQGKQVEEGAKSGVNIRNSLAEKTWQDLDLALETTKETNLKIDSPLCSLPVDEIKQEIKSEIDPSAQFKCGKCEHISSSEASLGMHMRKVHSEPIKKQKKMFSSNLCTKSNPLKDRIGMHLKKQHPKPSKNGKSSQSKVKVPTKSFEEEENEAEKIQRCLMEISEDEEEGDEEGDKVFPVEKSSEIKIKMKVKKLATASEAANGQYEKPESKKEAIDKEDSLKKSGIEQMLEQLKESNYFKSQSQKNLFFVCPPKVRSPFINHLYRSDC